MQHRRAGKRKGVRSGADVSVSFNLMYQDFNRTLIRANHCLIDRPLTDQNLSFGEV